LLVKPVMSHSLRLLTTSRYLRYVRALTALGHRWDVIAADAALQREPWRAARELPDARVISGTVAQQRLARGDYDAVVCHGLGDLDALGAHGVPAIVVFHATAALDRLCGLATDPLRRQQLAQLERAVCVFSSTGVQQSWERAGTVIPMPVDDAVRCGGELAAALRIDRYDYELACLSGGTSLDDALRGLPCTVLGGDLVRRVSDDGAVRTDAVRADALRRHRVFVSAAHEPFATGASAALLDAMAAGMPVVTAAGADTPVVHGVNGFVAADTAGVRNHVLELLSDRDLAMTLGRAGREQVLASHGRTAFGEAWQHVLDAVCSHDASRSSLAAAS
jgi:glycosyltransferase involved in cell wall biosynthesis